MQPLENMVVADRFRLVRMIGRGGMGSVWQAVHVGLDTPCAVKFIEGDLAKMAEAQTRFEREAKAAAQLRSSHVVSIFDHGVWQDTPYIAMELLEGEDLGKRLTRTPGMRLNPAAVNAIVQQVCRALTKAHQAGIVHRDLKPDNIFLVADDDREIVKILDFGVAKQTSTGIDGTNTKTGAMLGTPYYMSPEQAQGIKSVDGRSDLWSLAVIVFQCLTGRLPFESDALGDLLVKIIVAPIPSPSQMASDLPVGFEAWWRRASERNPDLRFQTAKELAESLQMALGQSSVSDITDRSVLQRFAGGTALMSNAAGGGSGPAAASAGGVTAGMPQGAGAPILTPQGMPVMTPPGGMPAAPPQASTGSPVAGTFSGVEPAGGGARRGVPTGVWIGVAALAFLGIGFGSMAIFARTRAAPEPPSASATAEPASSQGEPAATVALEGAASAAASAEPAAAVTTVSEPSNDAPDASASAEPAPAPTAAPVATHESSPHEPSTPKPTRKATKKATKKAAGKGNFDLGF